MADTHGNWPFQVAIPDDFEVGIAATAYCTDRDLSLRVMGPSVIHQGRRWDVYCFTYYDDGCSCAGPSRANGSTRICGAACIPTARERSHDGEISGGVPQTTA